MCLSSLCVCLSVCFSVCVILNVSLYLPPCKYIYLSISTCLSVCTLCNCAVSAYVYKEVSTNSNTKILLCIPPPVLPSVFPVGIYWLQRVHPDQLRHQVHLCGHHVRHRQPSCSRGQGRCVRWVRFPDVSVGQGVSTNWQLKHSVFVFCDSRSSVATFCDSRSPLATFCETRSSILLIVSVFPLHLR